MAYSVQVVVADIAGSIKISIEFEMANSTTENGLMRTIRTTNMSATTALLRSVSRIDIVCSNAFRHSFVHKKLFQLTEVPFVNLFPLFFSHSNSLPNTLEFFKDHRASCFQRINNLLCNAVVSIPTKPCLFHRNATKVSFARMPFGLQLAPQPFVSFGYGFDLLSTEELIVRGNSKIHNPSINPDKLLVGRSVGNLLLKDNMQKDFTVSNKKISRSPLPIDVLLEVVRDQQFELQPSADGLDGDIVGEQLQGVTVGIITNRTLFGFWTSCVSALLDFCCNGFKRFSGFHSSRNSQLGRKIFSGGLVSQMVQRNSVGFFGVPTDLTSKIVGFGVGINSRLESLWRSLNDQFSRSCQFHILCFDELLYNSCKNVRNVLTSTKGSGRHILPDAEDIGVSCLPTL